MVKRPQSTKDNPLCSRCGRPQSDFTHQGFVPAGGIPPPGKDPILGPPVWLPPDCDFEKLELW